MDDNCSHSLPLSQTQEPNRKQIQNSTLCQSVRIFENLFLSFPVAGENANRTTICLLQTQSNHLNCDQMWRKSAQIHSISVRSGKKYAQMTIFQLRKERR